MVSLLVISALATPPSTEDCLLFASDWQAWALSSPEAPEVAERLVPRELPGGVSSEYSEALVESLGDDAALGRLLATSSPQLAIHGPDYARVIFSSDPPLSLVVREENEQLVADRIEITSCRICSEPARAVHDLLARSQAGEAVFWPNLDLSVRSAREARAIPAQRVAALQKRAIRRELAPMLAAAEVTAVDDTLVHVEIAGVSDTWQLVFEEGRYLVEYDSLSDDSPIRLGRRDAEDFRPRTRRTSELLALYEPDGAAVPGGRQLTTRVIGAAFDPHDGTVLTAVFDVDRATAGLLRLDPSNGDVVDRWRTRAAPRIPIDLESWFDSWHLALSPNGKQVALSSPGQIEVLDLVSGRRERVYAFDQASDLEWVTTPDGPTLVIGQRTAIHLVRADGGHGGVRVDGAMVGAVSTSGGFAVLTERGTLHRYDVASRTITEATAVCCGAARGIAGSETRGELAVTCPATCETAGERHPLAGVGMSELSGSGTHGAGIAWSPDGTLLATAAMGAHEGLLLWNSRGEPIASAGEGTVRTLAFDPRGERLLAVTTAGALHVFEVDDLIAAGLDTAGQ